LKRISQGGSTYSIKESICSFGADRTGRITAILGLHTNLGPHRVILSVVTAHDRKSHTSTHRSRIHNPSDGKGGGSMLCDGTDFFSIFADGVTQALAFTNSGAVFLLAFVSCSGAGFLVFANLQSVFA